jgi:hypothetical protein
MRRILTQDVGRWPKGHVFDRSPNWFKTWFPGFEKFSVEVDEAAMNSVDQETSQKSRRGRPPKREASHVA